MKKILFACAENRKRSQIAEALFNHLAKSTSWRAESAGTMPADAIDPLAIQVLQEIDVSAKNQKPKKVTQEMLGGADMIISFGCLVSSMFPKDKFREWIVDDPKTLDDFRRVCNDLQEKIKQLIKELTAL
jgi:arsenate reductase